MVPIVVCDGKVRLFDTLSLHVGDRAIVWTVFGNSLEINKDITECLVNEELRQAFNSSDILRVFTPAVDSIVDHFKSTQNWVERAHHKYLDLYRRLGYKDDDRLALLALMDPEFNVEDETVSYFRDGTDLVKGRKVTTKIGKFVRATLHDNQMSDNYVERRVNIIKDFYFPRKYTLLVGSTREDFRHAYSHNQATYRDPRTTYARKSLAASCMRYSRKPHPAEYYASGDFQIVWLEDDSGRIAGRVVVGNGAAAPCYGVDEQSLDQLESYLKENNILKSGYHTSEHCWIGLKLLAIPDGGGSYVAAYLDDYEAVTLAGDYFIIDDRGEVSAKDHEGYFYTSTARCSCCDDLVRGDEVYTDEQGSSYCDECYYDRFTHCEVSDSEIPREEAIEVNSLNWSMTVHEDYAVETEEDGWWYIEDTVQTEDGMVYPCNSPNILPSDLTSSIYHVDDLEVTDDGLRATKEELIEEGYTYNEEEGHWVLSEGEEEECQTEAA